MFADCKLYITVSYLRLRVFEQLCSRPGGVRIFYDTGVPVTNVHEYREVRTRAEQQSVRGNTMCSNYHIKISSFVLMQTLCSVVKKYVTIEK